MVHQEVLFFLKDNIRVIGINKAGKKDKTENYADFIGPIFNYFKNLFIYKIIYKNGDYYIGELKNNLRQGKGKFYMGKIINEGKEYYGKLKYEGEYLNGERNGKCKEYNSNGKLIFEGEYLNGERWNGKVKECYNDGILEFEGEYLNGKRNGKGKEYDTYGKLEFEGEYLNGRRKGHNCTIQ